MSTAHELEGQWYRHGMVSLSPGMTMEHTLKLRLGSSVEVAQQTSSPVFVKPQLVLYEMDGELAEGGPSLLMLDLTRLSVQATAGAVRNGR